MKKKKKFLKSLRGALELNFLKSAEIFSKFTNHAPREVSSTLDGQSSEKSGKSKGLHFVGPKNPDGSSMGLDQVLPPSLVRQNKPFHLRGESLF